MTVVRAAPALQVETIGPGQYAELSQLLTRDPLANVVIASRLEALAGTRRAGAELLAVRDPVSAALRGAAFDGGNLVPIGGGAAEWSALAAHVGRHPRVCTAIVGRAAAVAALWASLAAAWGPARAIRPRQPLLVLHRGEPVGAAPDPRVRPMRPDELDVYLPAAAAMFAEELGVSPYLSHPGDSYRRRAEALIAAGRAFGIRDADGAMVFKADIAAVSAETAQVQGVWVRPDLRGRGIGTGALAAVLGHALTLAPTVSLYVNEFNVPARRVYARLGMHQRGELATVLF